MSILKKLVTKLDTFLNTKNNLIATVSVLAAYGVLSIACDIIMIVFYAVKMLGGLLLLL
jgi:hypothetical protein